MTTENPANATQGAETPVSQETPSTPTTATETPSKATTEGNAQEAKVEETKTAEEPAKVVPEKYDFKIPEGSLLTQEEVAKAEAYAKEKGMTQEEAQSFLQSEHDKFQDVFNARKVAFDKQVESWKEASLKDPEIGGENFAKNMEYAKRAVEKHGSPEMAELLNQSGLGNHPSFVKFFANYGKEMADDTVEIPNAQGLESDPNKRMYPTMFK